MLTHPIIPRREVRISTADARSQLGRACRARMVDARTQALVTFPVTLRLDTGDFGMEQSIRLVLMCQLLETKLLQLLRFQTGGVCPEAASLSC